MNYLGIDVSKKKIDCCLIVEKRYFHRVVKNDSSGFDKLQKWLAKYGESPVYACLEATGIYSEHVAEFLHDNGHQVALANPLSIKKFAEMQLLAVKTDKHDAKTIAIYCQKIQPRTYTPAPPIERELKALTRQLDYLKDMLVAQQNRFQVAQSITQPIISETIDNLRRQIQQLQQTIQKHINEHPELKTKAELLKSVRGIGAATVPHLLTLFGSRSFENSKQVVSYLGLNPIVRQSGNRKTSYYSISKQGDKHIRTSLYMPAVRSFSLPEWQPFIKRLRDAGKTGKQIVCAIMRKLAIYCFVVLKQQKPFLMTAGQMDLN